MRITVFIFLFGLVLILGLFLSVFWTKSVIVRWKKVKGRWHWHEDRALILSSGIALTASGLSLVYGSRLVFSIFYDLSPMLQGAEAWPVAAGLTLMLIGHLLLVWLADLEIEPPRWGWLKAMFFVSLAWLVVSIYLMPLVPLYPADLNTRANDFEETVKEKSNIRD